MLYVVTRMYNFQLVLHKSGEININYQSMQGDLESATIGIKSPSGNDGLEVVYNDSFIENDLSLSFNTSNWLSSSLLSGDSSQLSSGSSATYLVNIDASSLNAGVYYAYIISNTNAVKVDSASVADDEYARFTANGLESRSTSEVLSDIGGQASLTFGKSDTNALKLEEAVSTNDILLAGSSNVKGRTYAELKSDLSLNNVENTALSTGTALNSTHVLVTDNESTNEENLILL